MSFERAEVTQNNSVRCHGNAVKNCVHAVPEKSVNLLEDELQSFFFAQPHQRMMDEPQLQMKAINDCLNEQPRVCLPLPAAGGKSLQPLQLRGKTDLILSERLPRQLPHFMNENKSSIFSERCFLPVALEAFCVRKVGCAETLT